MNKEERMPFFFLAKSLMLSYILTAVLLLLLALLLYKLDFGEGVVSIAITVIYVAATFFAGFLAGKKQKNRKFLWGLLMGCAYFVVLSLLSLLASRGSTVLGDSFLTTWVLCAAGGMLGGMLG